jgi:multiple sugar transport system permease protein
MPSLRAGLAYFQKPQGAAYIFLLPSMTIFALFLGVPLLATFAIGTLKLDIFLQKFSFVGWGNFSRVIADDRFWNSMKNTLVFTLFEVPLQVGLALLVALAVQSDTRFRRFTRSALFLPVVCSMTAVSIVWSMLLDPSMGIVPFALRGLGFVDVDFLKSRDQAMATVIGITVWKNFGMSMIILVAGLQSIPVSLFEAARIDGAGKFRMFASITVPMLAGPLGFCVITNTIGSLQVFDQVYVMTQGGPLLSTETVVQYIYNRGFRIPPYELGYASALAEALFVVIALVTFLTYRSFFRKEAGR